MKLVFLIPIFLLAAVLFAENDTSKASLSLANIPLYGVTKTGVYFVAKDLVAEVGGVSPRVVFAPKMKKLLMVESGKYYIFRSGQRIILPRIAYCFDIGGGKYLPHVLIDGRGVKFASQIDSVDIKDNNGGGYNFFTRPLLDTEEIK